MSDTHTTSAAQLEEDMSCFDGDERDAYLRHVVAQGDEAGFAADYVAAASAALIGQAI